MNSFFIGKFVFIKEGNIVGDPQDYFSRMKISNSVYEFWLDVSENALK